MDYHKKGQYGMLFVFKSANMAYMIQEASEKMINKTFASFASLRETKRFYTFAKKNRNED